MGFEMLATESTRKKPKTSSRKTGKFATANSPGALLIGSLEAAKLLGLGITVLTREAAAGNIPAFKIGGKWVFSRAALEAWIANSAQSGMRGA
jgi:excisionase family DNA binding protein